MKYISERQVNDIKDYIEKCNISSNELKEDLIDHFICFIESEINKGMTFDDAFLKSKIKIFPNEIEERKIMLFSGKRMKRLKIWVVFTLMISICMFFFGATLKFKHLPGGHSLIICALILFVILCLPSIIIYLCRNNLLLFTKIRNSLISGIILVIIFLVGVFFKLNHWRGGDIIIIISLCSLSLILLPYLFFKLYRPKK